MSEHTPPHDRLVQGTHTYESIGEKIYGFIFTNKFFRGWIFGLAIALGLLGLLNLSLGWLLVKGIGVWGLNVPVGWGFDITNFVWWIGIGHAGTLISAILLLLHQKWRASINRFAEAMTLFAVACAAIFPGFHVGRPWRAYFLAPYPNTMSLWPQFRSPLLWDFFAVSTYGSVSLMFWYVGLIPDFANLRDKAKHPLLKILYGVLSLGWRGSANHWHTYQTAYLLLAGLSTPLVLSVHSIVSFDFAVSNLPGWHTTIFPPYFVAGAVYSGFAMVLTCMLPLRKYYKLQDFITERHIDLMAKVMLGTGLIVAYGYVCEGFIAWLSGSPWELALLKNRLAGDFSIFYYALILFNILIPQLLWFRKYRLNLKVLFVMSLVINVGMWLERFVIIVGSLRHDFLPSSWAPYTPTIWEIGLYLGTIGLFATLMLLFVRFMPFISMTETREIYAEEKGDVKHG